MAEFWYVTQQVLFYLAIANVVLAGLICTRFLIGFCQIKRLGDEDSESPEIVLEEGQAGDPSPESPETSNEEESE